MAYSKQEFKTGDILLASQLNHIEDGIVEVEKKVDSLGIPETTDVPLLSTNNSWTAYNTFNSTTKLKSVQPFDDTGLPLVSSDNTKYWLSTNYGLDNIVRQTGASSTDAVTYTYTYPALNGTIALQEWAKEYYTPTYIKYISFDDDIEVMTALANENKAAMIAYEEKGIFKTEILLWDVANNSYYPMKYAVDTETQLDIIFTKGNGTYSIVWNKERKSFGFSE